MSSRTSGAKELARWAEAGRPRRPSSNAISAVRIAAHSSLKGSRVPTLIARDESSVCCAFSPAFRGQLYNVLLRERSVNSPWHRRCSAIETMMRDPIRVWRTGTALHRWLRRAAVTAVPLVGLCGCGNDCHDTVGTSSRFVDGGIAWAPGSSHSAVECFHDFRNPTPNPCVREPLTRCPVAVDGGVHISCQTRGTKCLP